MVKKKIIVSVIILLFITSFLFISSYEDKNFRVAHAGGEYNELTYSNSLNAIKKNLANVKYFELDLQITKDNRLVCLHDPNIHDLSFDEIKKELLKNNKCYDQKLKKFLDFNKDIFIITDFKTDNIQGLKFIKNNFYEHLDKFIPQIYFKNEYDEVKKLGFNKIIFTLYKVPNLSNEQIITDIKKMDLFAITMDPARLRKGLVKQLHNKNFIIYVYTVNSYLRFLQYKLFYGMDEIYTDNLFY